MDDIFETLYVSRGSGREGEGAPKEQGGGGGSAAWGMATQQGAERSGGPHVPVSPALKMNLRRA